MESVPFPRVTLVWHDAHTDYSSSWWHPGEELEDEPAVIHSTGWLITPSHKPGHWMLAQSYSPTDGALGECLFIPEAMVVRKIPLYLSQPRRTPFPKARRWVRDRVSWW